MNLYADCIFAGGRIYTADPARPSAEAVAVAGGRILALGRQTDLAELRGPATEIVDLAGRMLLPGFTDSHIHFIETALRAAQVDATGAESAAAVAELVRARVPATPPGCWIRGGGWYSALWTDGEPAHCRLLDAVAPDVPVALDSKDLHSVWVNSLVLRRAGIDGSTRDVPGGVIERDPDGEPTGVLRDQAMSLLAAVNTPPGLAETVPAVRAAVQRVWQSGIVAIHSPTTTVKDLSFSTFQELWQNNELGLRVLQHLPAGHLEAARTIGLQSGLGDAWLRIGGIKMFADGALGSRTAHMLAPYLGDPANWGVATTDPEEMLELALAASAAGLSLAIHAIGDRAIRSVLDILAEVRRREQVRGPQTRPLRHRIEHVQCISEEDLPRLAPLGIIASVQPIHATSDMLMVDRHWGAARALGAYAFRRLLESGAHLVFGSDSPVEPYSPLIGIHAAVTRQRADGSPGPDGWQGQERLAVVDAVDAYTYWPAYAAGEEAYRGSITPGKVADLIVLSRDIFSVPPAEILETEVDLTVLDGRIVWRGDRR